jgi:hypothetical protein
MITFVIGLFIGSLLGTIFTAILAMSRDENECAMRKPYRRHLISNFNLFGRLGLKSR